MFGSYTILVFVLNFLIQSHQTMACFIRIFRVLHTVQSSVFKVRLLSICVSSNFYILSQWFIFVNHFFHFLQNSLSGQAGRFSEKFAAVFSGEVYHTKSFDKSQHIFCIFLFFFIIAIIAYFYTQYMVFFSLLYTIVSFLSLQRSRSRRKSAAPPGPLPFIRTAVPFYRSTVYL